MTMLVNESLCLWTCEWSSAAGVEGGGMGGGGGEGNVGGKRGVVGVGSGEGGGVNKARCGELWRGSVAQGEAVNDGGVAGVDNYT